MADIHFEETCPCGTSVKMSGYTSEIRSQIQIWQSMHNKHMNAIAKSVADGTKHPSYYIWPYQSTPGGNGAINYTTTSSHTFPDGLVGEKKSE